MTELKGRPTHQDDASADEGLRGFTFELPTSRNIRKRLLVTWFAGLVVFGLLPAVTYGWFAWLLSAQQWRAVWLVYATWVPLWGGGWLVIVPLLWMRPVLQALDRWHAGAAFRRRECAEVYTRCMLVPRWMVNMCLFATSIGYLGGSSLIFFTMHQPAIEYVKTFPALILVAGLSSAYCYFGTLQALQPVISWCSARLQRLRSVSKIPLDVKFMAVTYILIVSVIAMLHPSAFTLGQVINENHLRENALYRLSVARQNFLRDFTGDRGAAEIGGGDDLYAILNSAAMGINGYVFAADPAGAIMTPHPRRYSRFEEEPLSMEGGALTENEGVFVSRLYEHRVVAHQYWPELGWRIFSIVYPEDFQAPLENYLQFSVIPIMVVLFMVMLFGNFFIHGMTAPLTAATRVAQRIAERGVLDEHVPLTTDDELGEMASAFNWMMRQLKKSHDSLERSNRRLEHSAAELATLNTEMEDFLHVVSHDLRAPLINIQGFAKRLERLMEESLQGLREIAAASDGAPAQSAENLREKVKPKLDESMQYISKGIEKMDNLLNQLLMIARVGRKSDPMEYNDLNALVDDVIATFNHQLAEARIEAVRLQLPDKVYCRRNEINQVFANLISNAIRYMGTGEPRRIEIGGSVVEDTGEAECFVKDSGIGIAKEDQERIFQTFIRLGQVDVAGEGVGLAYVRKVVRSHGGRIWVESEPGKGSRFLFRLPRNGVKREGQRSYA